MDASGQTDERPIDFAWLARQTFGDGQLEKELLQLFEGQCLRLLPIIAHAPGMTQRADAAHSLKGAAKAIGAWDVARYAEAIEDHLRSAPQDQETPEFETQGLSEAIAAALKLIEKTVHS